ncbi:uncharacterized protein LOC113555237 isoform X2 [Rhopalosiphum maidis]|uniref:uncharacterized protein LOC113555237 isoform X2 n=1 Tax=Rhopalosiphum maidis TaxID=43146 RepID=UPI000EFEFB99|nr:uncharacterized protein LOC113555237 isoform X2 [Rhopalosiphum maidis]
MFQCSVCDKTFTRISSLNRHTESHDVSNEISCSTRSEIFTRKDNFIRHCKNKQHSNTVIQQKTKQKAKKSYDYKVPSTSNRNGLKRHHVNNLNEAVNAKKSHMDIVNTTHGFSKTGTSLSKKINWYYMLNTDELTNYSSFLETLKRDLIQLLKSLSTKHPIKYNLKLETTYNRPHVDNSAENRTFKTSAKKIFMDTDIEAKIDINFADLLSEEDVYTSKGSGFTLQSIDGLGLGVYKYTPMGGSSYIPLPNDIKNKKAVINPQNSDQNCFKWSILAKHVLGNNKNLVAENYTSHEEKYNFTDLTFPTPIEKIKIFEKNNQNVSVNVYSLKKQKKSEKHIIYPLKVADEEKKDHFDLLLITNGDKSHYTYISNFSRLVRAQKTSHTESVIFCKRCFKSYDNQLRKNTPSGQAALDQHKLICGPHKPILPQMPAPGTMLEFNSWNKTQRHPIVIYADFEALLVKCHESKSKKILAFQKHEPMSYGFVVKATENVPAELLKNFNIPQEPIIFRGNESHRDVAKRFVNEVTEVAKKVENLLKTNEPIIMTEEDQTTHKMTNTCNLCKCNFSNKNNKVADHCHLSGKFRQTLCNTCNLKLQTPSFIPCFIHNLSNYDAHFIVTELGYDSKTISVIPNSEEKLISFSKYVNKYFSIRFIDSCRFMASSLSTLASNLITSGFEKFRETAKNFLTEDMQLVTRKGVYPYDYTDSWNKLKETNLPKKSDFYSELTELDIDDYEYEHAKTVWNHFKCKNLGEYSDLYLKIDVLLLADVFENFRDMCISTYNLDPVYYYTAPGFSFDCMLKCTKIKLELLSDFDMHLFFENSIRGGLTQASMRYAKANHENTPDYDTKNPKSWIVYQDCNNLYGWAMSQYMPYGYFEWVDPKLDGLDVLTPTSDIGRVYEVDISYPQHLHNKHNDLPFLPENKIPPGSRVKKLVATLHSKKNYIIHYRNLQQAIANGLIVEKVHRVLEFRQSDWLATYIHLNTEMRKKAVNEFEKDFFKLLNNAVFGKTMESMRKRIKMELVSCPNRLQKLLNEQTFKHCTTYSENLAAVSLENKIIEFCKPIYIGFAVLDISKTLMYDYHYNVMQKHYGEKIELLYTDTDSLVYYIQTDNFYNDLANNSNLLDRMDTANLPQDHLCYIAERKKIPGLFSDETDGRIIREFIALRAKSYAYILEDEEKIKAKGVQKHVVKNHMTFENHKKCLFSDDDKDKSNLYRENISIRSSNHQIQTTKSNKLCFNQHDDKRIVQSDNIHTYAHGHFKINC